MTDKWRDPLPEDYKIRSSFRSKSSKPDEKNIANFNWKGAFYVTIFLVFFLIFFLSYISSTREIRMASYADSLVSDLAECRVDNSKLLVKIDNKENRIKELTIKLEGFKQEIKNLSVDNEKLRKSLAEPK